MNRPVVLLTDFADRDGFAGVMKGVIASVSPGTSVIDLAHNVPPHDIRHAAYVLLTSFSHFPEGSIFCCVVDPGVGSKRNILIAEFEGRILLAPDNGVLSWLLGDKIKTACILKNGKWVKKAAGSTFDGRDRFAPAAALLACGKLKASSFTQKAPAPQVISGLEVVEDDRGCRHTEIIHVDVFGNLVTGFTQAENVKNGKLEIGTNVITSFVKSYSDLPEAEPGAVLNSAGFWEIAVKNRRASERLRLQVGSTVSLEGI